MIKEVETGTCKICKELILKHAYGWGHSVPPKAEHGAVPGGVCVIDLRLAEVTRSMHSPPQPSVLPRDIEGEQIEPNPTLIDFGQPPEWRWRLTERDLREVELWQVRDSNRRLHLDSGPVHGPVYLKREDDGHLHYGRLGTTSSGGQGGSQSVYNAPEIHWWAYDNPNWDSPGYPLEFRPAPVDGKWVQWPTSGTGQVRVR